MIPEFNLKPQHDRAVAMMSKTEGVIVIETMRFMFPFEAKLEADAKFPKMCHHRRKPA